MFSGNMVTEAIPARVFALYKIVADKKDISRIDLRGLMEPKEIHEGTSYFSEILKAATELKLVDQIDNSIIPIVPREQGDVRFGIYPIGLTMKTVNFISVQMRL